jgi:hypothetical protein
MSSPPRKANRRLAWFAPLAALSLLVGPGAAHASIGDWLEGFASPADSTVPANVDEGSLLANQQSQTPHPAVVRVVAPENGATSFGSGTLVDVRDDFGLVVTNWHVVRDATGDVEVHFPCGFRSKARALKVDADWDLAALVVWRPPVAPVRVATVAPQSGDRLTICGYGQGEYRAATGRCTKYYAPRADFPEHMVELDVEARQGDSGGPIFNERGEIAGVLFGAGEGTTLGSFGGRVSSFLATLAPDIGGGRAALAATDVAGPRGGAGLASAEAPAIPGVLRLPATEDAASAKLQGQEQATAGSWQASTRVPAAAASPAPQGAATPGAATGPRWFAVLKDVLAAVGVVAIAVQALRLVR